MNRVVHPNHYNWIPNIECMDVVKHFDFLLGNAIKYIWRAGHKDSATEIEDLEKAVYYLNIKIEELKKAKNNAPIKAN